MQFGPCSIEKAAGAVLAHSIRAGGTVLKKGRLLSAEDIALLRRAGWKEVTVARLEPGDVREDEAAARIARAAAGGGVRVGAAFTGRANLFAEADGVAVIDAVRVETLNTIDEAVTLATVAPFARVTAGQMLATIKIIPFAAPTGVVTQAERMLSGGAVSVAPFKPHNAALILTTLPGTKIPLLDKTRDAVETRLRTSGSKLVFEDRVVHETGAIARALWAAQESACDPILLFGASAIADRSDAIPNAIVQAGGRIEHFGMPVDPGNLLLIGRFGGAAVVGLPGCARSPKLNGFDFVLWRLLADLPVGSAEIARMGVGGLLAEIPSRPQPRADAPSGTPRAPKVAAVILAAGMSSRMGAPKLLAEVGGRPIVRHVVDATLSSSARPVIVVTGSHAGEVEKALAGLQIMIVKNPDFAKGLSESLKHGLGMVPPDCDAALVLLADMPGIGTALIEKLVAAFDPAEGRAICVATRRGKRGNPVLWARRFFPEIMRLEGDVGAKSLMGLYGEFVCEVEADDDGPITDIDTPADLAAWSAR